MCFSPGVETGAGINAGICVETGNCACVGAGAGADFRSGVGVGTGAGTGVRQTGGVICNKSGSNNNNSSIRFGLVAGTGVRSSVCSGVSICAVSVIRAGVSSKFMAGAVSKYRTGLGIEIRVGTGLGIGAAAVAGSVGGSGAGNSSGTGVGIDVVTCMGPGDNLSVGNIMEMGLVVDADLGDRIGVGADVVIGIGLDV